MQKEKKILNLDTPNTVYNGDTIRNVYKYTYEYNIPKMINRLEWDMLACSINHALMVSASMKEDTIQISDNIGIEDDKHIMIFYGEDQADKISLFYTDSVEDLLYYMKDRGYTIKQIDDQKFYTIFFDLSLKESMRMYAESIYDYIVGTRRSECIKENTKFKLADVFNQSKVKNEQIEKAIFKVLDLGEDPNSIFRYILAHLNLVFNKTFKRIGEAYYFNWGKDEKGYYGIYKKKEKKDDNMVKQI